MVITKPEQAHRLWAEAFNAGDLESLMAMYAPDARFVPQPGQVLTGQAALREALQGFLALKGQIRMETAYVVQAGDIALVRAQWQLTAKDADGKPLAMSGNSTEVYRQQSDGTWLLLIDHPYGAD
jgi:uncharacterized protein (TIGR02246 family)